MTEEYLHLFTIITRTVEQLEELKAQLLHAQAEAEDPHLKRTDDRVLFCSVQTQKERHPQLYYCE